MVALRRSDQLFLRIVCVDDADLLSQDDDAHQQDDGDRPEQQQGRGSVARLRLLERRYAVADGLDAGQCGTARGECAGDQEREGNSVQMRILGVERERRRFRVHILAEDVDPEESPPEHQEHTDDECVGRNCERGPRFTDTAKVDRGQQHDRRNREQHLVLRDERQSRADVRRRRRDRHGDRQHVVDHQRTTDGQTGGRAEVDRRDLVVAATGGVCVDVLAVARHHHSHDDGDGQSDPGCVRIRGNTRDGENQEDFFGGIRDGRHRVGREDR